VLTFSKSFERLENAESNFFVIESEILCYVLEISSPVSLTSSSISPAFVAIFTTSFHFRFFKNRHKNSAHRYDVRLKILQKNSHPIWSGFLF